MKEILTGSVYFGVALTLLGYMAGIWLRRWWKSPLCNPILIGIVLVMGCLLLLDVDYASYHVGAQHLTYLLTPATVCLAIGLYQQLALLRQNWRALLGGIGTGVLTGLVSLWALSLLFGFSHAEYATLLPKSVTSAIGMDLSAELGGYPAITIAIIVIVGNLGNIFAEPLCRLLRITEPSAQGIAVGTAAHAAGTARAIEMGPVQGAMSSLALVLSGLITVVGASFFGNLI